MLYTIKEKKMLLAKRLTLRYASFSENLKCEKCTSEYLRKAVFRSDTFFFP